MNKLEDFKPGDQVIYLGEPNKESENIADPEVGEVVSVGDAYVSVRLWDRDSEGNPTELQKATKLCKPENLHKKPN